MVWERFIGIPEPKHVMSSWRWLLQNYRADSTLDPNVQPRRYRWIQKLADGWWCLKAFPRNPQHVHRAYNLLLISYQSAHPNKIEESWRISKWPQESLQFRGFSFSFWSFDHGPVGFGQRFMISFLVGGWTNPFEEYDCQNGFIFPKSRCESKTYLKPPSSILQESFEGTFLQSSLTNLQQKPTKFLHCGPYRIFWT